MPDLLACPECSGPLKSEGFLLRMRRARPGPWSRTSRSSRPGPDNRTFTLSKRCWPDPCRLPRGLPGRSSVASFRPPARSWGHRQPRRHVPRTSPPPSAAHRDLDYFRYRFKRPLVHHDGGAPHARSTGDRSSTSAAERATRSSPCSADPPVGRGRTRPELRAALSGPEVRRSRRALRLRRRVGPAPVPRRRLRGVALVGYFQVPVRPLQRGARTPAGHARADRAVPRLQPAIGEVGVATPLELEACAAMFSARTPLLHRRCPCWRRSSNGGTRPQPSRGVAGGCRQPHAGLEPRIYPAADYFVTGTTLNPVYEVQEEGDSLRLRRRFVSDKYSEAYRTYDRFLPESLTVTKEQVAAARPGAGAEVRPARPAAQLLLNRRSRRSTVRATWSVPSRTRRATSSSAFIPAPGARASRRPKGRCGDRRPSRRRSAASRSSTRGSRISGSRRDRVEPPAAVAAEDGDLAAIPRGSGVDQSIARERLDVRLPDQPLAPAVGRAGHPSGRQGRSTVAA
jgi:hypothetical protein